MDNINKKFKLLIIPIVLILLAGNLFFGIWCYKEQKEIKILKESLAVQKINEKVLDFTKAFINKVLRAESEVNFENRLLLENKVRDIKDEEIFSYWEKFTNSKTENEAQINVKNLLDILINKITVK